MATSVAPAPAADDAVSSYLARIAPPPPDDAVSSYLTRIGQAGLPAPVAPRPSILRPLRPLRTPMVPADATKVTPAAVDPMAEYLASKRGVRGALNETGAMAADIVKHPIRSTVQAITAPVTVPFAAGEALGEGRYADAAKGVAQSVAMGVAPEAEKILGPVATGAGVGATFGGVPGAVVGAAGGAATKAITKLKMPSAPLAPAGLEERNAGLSIPKEVLDQAKTANSQAFTNPYGPIAAEHPALSDALLSAGAMTAPKAEAFVRQMGNRVIDGLSPEQASQFETRRVAENLATEATRKAAGADALSTQAVNHRMEVRALAKQELEGAQAKADAVQQAGQAKAAAEMANAPPEAPTNLDLDPAARASRQKAIAAHAAKVQGILDDAKADAADIMRPAQADHDMAVKAGDETHERVQKEAFAKKQAASRATTEAAELLKRVPPGVENEPWFQEALEKHEQMVGPFNEAAALRSGVDPRSLRQTPLGYTRLTKQDVLNEQLIGKTQEAAAPKGEFKTEEARAAAARKAAEAITPRTGIRLKAVGQKPAVNALLPAGAEALQQGPANVARETPSSVAAPTAATAATGSAKEFRGAEGYSTDYLTNIARDAGDKVTKAAKNGVFQALANEAMQPNATVRKLVPEENPRPGERLLAFNDQKDIIQPPAKTDPNYQAVQRFAVPPDVADAFARFQSKPNPRGRPRQAWDAVNAAVMTSVLKTPILSVPVAAGHTLTEGSNVSRGLPAEAGTLKTIATGVPIVKTGHAITRAIGVDMEAPETTTRLHRLALSGALRLSDERGQGWADAAHEALFGPNGIDTRMRVIASQDAEYAWKQAGGTLTDPAFTGWERDYVNGHSGNYTGKNQGTAVHALQESGLVPFIAIGRAKVGGSIEAMAGRGGPPGEAMLPRLLRFQRSPLGQAAQIAGAGYLLSGHAPTENAPGHETDLATGVYHLPDANGVYQPYDRASYKYFRGSPDEAARVLGADAKEQYLRKGFADPSSAIVTSILAPIAYAKPGDKVSETMKAAANAALQFPGPSVKTGVELATGHDMYFDRDGALGSVQGIHLSKDADLTDRILAAARNVNAGAAVGIPAPGSTGRSVASALLGNLNPLTEAKAGTAPRVAQDVHTYKAKEAAFRSAAAAEKDPVKRAAMIADFQQEQQRFIKDFQARPSPVPGADAVSTYLNRIGKP